jgi:hypothetical protein
MKGFLNKVQRRVSGSGPSGETKSTDNGSNKPSTPNSMKTANGTNRGVEATPKADVSLPRRERR